LELPWPIKLRITAVLALGVVVIGIWAWPLAAPPDPIDIVAAYQLTPLKALGLVALSAIVGVLAYLIPWPYGRQIGPLAVPAGLAVWALRSGPIARLMQRAPDLGLRLGVFMRLRYDSIFWLVMVAAGIAGVWLAAYIWPSDCKDPADVLKKGRPRSRLLSDSLIGLAFSLAIAYLLVAAFAQGTGVIAASIPTQPAARQIAFAVLVAFWAAGFLTARFLRLGPYGPIIASALLPMMAIQLFARPDIIGPVIRQYPATCLPKAILAVLPIQMVSFGAIGAIAGYWTAVRFEYWKRNLAG